MATPNDSRAVKPLNESNGSKRFKFKNFYGRMNDNEIKVFRSLDKVKAEPSEGSTFFKDCLVELRELNTAAEFILFYEEMLPFVQTLPLVILQKELIFSKLISGLQMKARFSLEAFLRLIAALSRDLLEDFLPFVPRIVDSLVILLQKLGHKDPEIIVQIFTSWSEIMMHLQKYLISDVEGILRNTLELRYYPDDCIIKLTSEPMSSLLRNAPVDQLEKGIKMILSEVADQPDRAGGVVLLYYVMRRTKTNLHSKAEMVLRFLLKDSTLSFPKGSGSSTVEVLSSAVQRLCEDYKVEELSVIWSCLYDEIKESVSNKNTIHLSRLLTVLTSAVGIKKGLKVHDYSSLIAIVSQIVSTFMAFSDNLSAVIDGVLRLILRTIDRSMSVSEMESIALQWAPIFALKSSSFLTFLREFLQKDQLIVTAFTSNILSAINNLIRGSSEEAMPLLLSLCERQQQCETFESRYVRIHEFLEENINRFQKNVQNTGLAQIDEAELATVWGVVNCYPYFKVDSSLLICLKNTLRQHLAISVVNTFSAPELMWQSLLGTALRSCHKLCSIGRINHSDLEEALSLAKQYKSCVQVLSPVAEYLDFVYRPALANDDSSKAYPELQADKAEDAFGIFSENLRHSNKDIRLQTLRILCHFETLSSEEHPPKKKLKTESLPKADVLQLLHTVEESHLRVSTEMKLDSLITRIHMELSAGRVHEAYVPLVFNGMIGIFHNRFSKMWERASECLADLMKMHTGAVWNDFVRYLGQCQLKLEALHNHTESENYSISQKYTGLMERFNSFLFPPSDGTPTATVVSLLLETLQKVPTVSQSQASDILPLFLRFLGYHSENPVRVGLYSGGACKGEEWKKLLI